MNIQSIAHERQCLPLGDLLVASGILSVEELAKTRKKALQLVLPLEDVLRRDKNVTEALLKEIVAEQCRPQDAAESDAKTTANEKRGKRNSSILQHLWTHREKQKALRAARRAENALLKMQREESQWEEQKQREKIHFEEKKRVSPFPILLLRAKRMYCEHRERYRKEQRVRREKQVQEKAIKLQEQKQKEEEVRRKGEAWKKKQEEDHRRKEEEKRRKEEARAEAEATKKHREEGKEKAREEEKKRRIEAKKQAAEAALAMREARNAKRAERTAQRALVRAARQMARRATYRALFHRVTGFASRGTKGDIERAAHRLIEEARQEAIRQVLIEREKQKIQAAQQPFELPASAMPGSTEKRTANTEASGTLLTDNEREDFSRERNALLGRIQELENGQSKANSSAEEMAEAEEEKKRRNQEAMHEAEIAFKKERTEWEIEKGRLKQQAIAEAETQFLGKMKRWAGIFGWKNRKTLSNEIIRWKKEAEKLEKERIALEREKALLLESQHTRKERKHVEEEKIRLARGKLAVEKQVLSTAEEEEKKLVEQQKQIDLANRSRHWKKSKEKKERKEGEEEEQAEKKPILDIGKILITQNYLEEAEYQSAKKRAEEQKISVETVLREEGLVTKDILQNAVAEYYHMPFVDVGANPPDTSIVELLPEELALSLHATAIEKKGETLVVATSSPERGAEITEQIVGVVEGVEKVEMVYTSRDAIDSALSFYRKPLNTRFQAIISEHKKIAPEIIEEIFADAIQLGASDIHFEPQEKIVIVRFRVDGVMHEAGKLPREYYEGIVNRIKIAGNMRIDEHFAAQDGAIRWKHSGSEKAMDVRVSIVPIVDGEKIVMRLLSEYVRTLTLRDLGFAGGHLDTLVKMAHKPFGMILTTGPTGSGKSTTLYGLLKIRNSPDVNISTIEDPVEYKIPGINHIQVNTKANLTFERGLRALVRQDPDIILVGEIRDDITAQISVNAALTGHLLFSTLHANDAATAIPRLLEMGIESYLLASTLEVIIAQRLMRRSCMNCRYSYTISVSDAQKLFPNADQHFKGTEEITLFKGKGCGNCGNTGFKGRVGVYELLVVSPEIEEMITNRRTSGEINILSRRQGMLTLFEDGLQKVLSGLTTVEELLRIAAPPDPLPALSS